MENLSQHTKGEWVVKKYRTNICINSTIGWGRKNATKGFPDQKSICDVSVWQSSNPEVQALHNTEAEANARLIASAPDMLDALKSLTVAIENNSEINLTEAYKAAVSAIAKAEGKG